MNKRDRILGSLGAICLALAIAMHWYLDSSPLFSFIKGMFLGLSVVLNLYTLIRHCQNRTVDK